jgi:hypothetical protein
VDVPAEGSSVESCEKAAIEDAMQQIARAVEAARTAKK